ncbi:MAG: DUF5684 domain-containing protein [Microbacterium arborescens]
MTGYGFAIDDAAVIALGGSSGGGPGLLAALGVVPMLVGIGVYVWTALALTAVFRKTGVEPWRAWVPVLNMWELFVLAGMRGWWAVVLAGGALVVGIVTTLITGLFAGAALNAGFGGDAGSAAGALAAAAIVPSIIWLGFVAFALVVHVRMLRPLCRGFGLGTGSIVLGAVLFPVWASVVGWGSARWLGAGASDSAGSTSPTTAATTGSTPPAPGGAASVPATAVFAPAPRPAGDPAASSTSPGTPAAPAESGPIVGSPWAPPPPPVEPDAVDATPLAWSAPPPGPVVDSPAAAAGPAATPAVAAVPPADAAPPVDDLDDKTVLAPRRSPQASLRLPDGSAVTLWAAAVVLGRNPLAPADVVDAQLVPVDDVTRTISKTHALLRLTDEGWTITDLASTNGVFVGADEVEASTQTAVTGVFHLGDAELHLEAG